MLTPFDFLKALGVTLALTALNVAASFAVVWAYSAFIETGHDAAFYEAAAQDIAPWSSVFVGGLLFLLAMLLLAWRRAGRNGYAFAATVVLMYAALDISLMAAAGAMASMAAFVALALLSKLAAALLGAWMSRPRTAAA